MVSSSIDPLGLVTRLRRHPQVILDACRRRHAILPANRGARFIGIRKAAAELERSTAYRRGRGAVVAPGWLGAPLVEVRGW
jgi:hypothetical protein